MTARNFIITALAALVVAVAAGSAAFAGLNLGGGGGRDAAEAHDEFTRYLTGYFLPNGNRFYINPNYHVLVQDEGSGCDITLASGLVVVPEGATTVTVPDGTVITSPESDGCTTSFGSSYPQDLTSPGGIPNLMRQRNNYVVTVGAATTTITAVPIEHQHGSTATGVTGTGFYCGRHYRWSEFETDENRPLFITAARHSLIGWVYVDSAGQQVASCNNHRPIFRPADQ